MFSLQGLVDAITTVPIFVTLVTAEYSLASGVGFLRFRCAASQQAGVVAAFLCCPGLTVCVLVAVISWWAAV